MTTAAVPRLVWVRSSGGVLSAAVRGERLPRRLAGLREFAIVRPARNANGNFDPTTQQWLAILDASRSRDGATSFDMTTVHATRADAVLHVTALAALEGFEVDAELT